MSSLRIMFASLAAPFVMAASSPTLPSNIPPLQERFSAVAIGGYTIYAKPQTLELGRDILPFISSMAAQDIIVVEPSRLEKTDKNQFLALPPVKKSFAPNLIKINPKAEKWLRDFQNSQNQEAIKFSRSLGEFFFTVFYAANESFKNGDNYSAQKLSNVKTCLVTGDLDANALYIVQKFGDVPQSLANEKFNSLFTDQKSILTLILLHEAQHCNQTNAQSGQIFSSQEMTLEKEIDADRAAIARYNQLIAQGEKLNPSLPKKFAQLRVLSPFLRSEGDLASVMSSLLHDHVTAAGLSGDEYNSADIYQQSSRAVVVFKSLLFQMADQAEVEKFKIPAEQQVDKFIDGYLQNTGRLWSKSIRSPEKLKKILENDKAMMSKLKPVLTDLVIADMVQKEHPQYAYQVLKIMAERGWIGPRSQESVFIPRMAAEALQAWDDLMLTKEDFSVADISKKLRLGEGPISFKNMMVKYDLEQQPIENQNRPDLKKDGTSPQPQ